MIDKLQMPTDADLESVTEFVEEMNKRYRQIVVKEETEWADQRRDVRQACPADLKVAIPFGEGIPADSAFYKVKCRDISPNGFSFWEDEEPSCKEFIVKFKVGVKEICVRARVARVIPEFDPGKSGFIIGCAFQERFNF